MIDKNDFIKKVYTSINKIRIQKWYMHYCDICSIKRSYLPKNKTGLCKSCSCKGRVISSQQKNNISKTLQGNTNFLGHTEESRKTAIQNMLETKSKWSDDNKKAIAEKTAASKLGLTVEEYRNSKEERIIRRKLSHNIRTQIYNFIKEKGQLKHVNWSIKDLKNHLESKFTEGMSWSNYGRIKGIRCWEIDHVVPLNAKINGEYLFKSLDDPSSDDFNKAWALDNLQPLWANDNNKKNNKL